MKPMKLGLAFSLFAVSLLAIFFAVVPQGASAEPLTSTWMSQNGPSSPNFEPTDGPKPGTYSFPDGDARGVAIEGRITPSLGSGVTASISSAKSLSCGEGGNDEVELDPKCFMGGGNGASFTGYVKTGFQSDGTKCLTSDCGEVKLTYKIKGGVDDGKEICVTIVNPDQSGVAVLDPGVTFIVPNQDLFVDVQVLGNNGQANATFDGRLRVIPGSLLGSGVLIDGSSGMTSVDVVDGVGTMRVRCENAVSGDVLTFDILGGGRLSPCRSSLRVY